MERLRPTYNAAPSQGLPVIRSDHPQAITLASWGFVPEWAKGKDVKPIINARAESIADKPFFRNAFRHKRCLVLADGFYEWKKVGARKVPYYVALKGAEPFAFAGLWSTVHDEDGKASVTFALITTEPNELMADIHHRMPVILRQADEQNWLDPGLSRQDAVSMLAPYPAAAMTMHPVSPRVNAPTYNVPEAIAEVPQ
jgi:putative SOS response-associated peptidase YedK